MSSENRSKSDSKSTQKMKSFNIAPIGKKPSKAELEKPKKQKTLEEQKAAAEVYEEFLISFDEPAKHGKLFVRGAVINAASGEEKSTAQSGKIYKPAKLVEVTKKEDKSETPKEKAEKVDKAKKKEKEKKKSNLELFKEELRMIQEEREERHRLKGIVKEQAKAGKVEPPVENQIRLADDYRYPSNYGSYDIGDPSTTNLYLGNLNPKITEPQLCEVFGKFGPLASVKIMWPRSDEERARGSNCGFVAFMNRRDGERAMKNLNGKDVMGFEMKLNWGKAVPIPPHPIYIPPAMAELMLPPPPSGLPFNAQIEKVIRNRWPNEPETKEDFEKLLATAVVKVVIPTERTLLCLIHRTVEFVVREGPMFEAMIMNREISNPMFRFLFDNKSPAHVYYRWRLYSILKGDHPSKWYTEEFRMFIGGSLWKPPPLNLFLQGMPEDLVKAPPPKPIELQKGSLSDTQRDKFEELLRNINPEKHKVADAMIYCIEHAEAAEEIIECIGEAIAAPEAPLFKKVARLYLISDVLHNCSVKIGNASFYRRGFEEKLPDIFKDLHDIYQSIEGRLRAEQFKQRVINCFKAWEDWNVYPSEFLIQLQNVFLGLVPLNSSKIDEGGDSSCDTTQMQDDGNDIDGVPLTDVDDIDGIPMDAGGLDDGVDIDGVPLNEDIEGQLITDDLKVENSDTTFTSKFKPSKWEMVDPETVEAQAITTSKWDLLEQVEEQAEEQAQEEEEEDIDGQPMEETEEQEEEQIPQQDEASSQDSSALMDSLKVDINEERRAKLREIELKVMKYQDELESGKRNRKPHMTFSEQVEHYRQKLHKKAERERHDHKECEKHKRERHKMHSHSGSPANESEQTTMVLSPDEGQSSGFFITKKGASPRMGRSPSDTDSPYHRSKSHRSRSPKKHKRSRSRSPKRSKRSRSKSPHKRYLSPDSSSPPIRKHKSKKKKH